MRPARKPWKIGPSWPTLGGVTDNHLAFPRTVPEGVWRVLADARQDRHRFREILATMNRGQLARLAWTYEEITVRLRLAWAAAQGVAVDDLYEQANWVVAQGKEYCCAVFEHLSRAPPDQADAGFMSQLVLEFEERYRDDIPINTSEWDDDWQRQGKKSPWGTTRQGASPVDQIVARIIAEKLVDVDASQVTSDARFVEDLGADPLDLLELVMALEDQFEIAISDADAEEIRTLRGAVSYLVTRG